MFAARCSLTKNKRFVTDFISPPPPAFVCNVALGTTLLAQILHDLDSLPTHFLPVGADPIRNPFMLLLNIDDLYRSPSTLSDTLVDGDVVSSMEMLRIRRACGIILMEEEQVGRQSLSTSAKSQERQSRGRSRKTRRGDNKVSARSSPLSSPLILPQPPPPPPNPSTLLSSSLNAVDPIPPPKTFFLPSRLSQSPYASSASSGRSRSASRGRNRSFSPYDARLKVERPSTTPATTRPAAAKVKKTKKKGKARKSRPSSAAQRHRDSTANSTAAETMMSATTASAPPPAAFIRVRDNVLQMKTQLEEMSAMLVNRGILESMPMSRPSTSPHFGQVAMHPRPSTSPQLASLHSQSRDPPTTTIYIIESIKVSNEDCILKFIRGEKNKDEKHYEDVNSMPLRIEAWDRLRKRRIQPLLLSAIECDRMCAYCPNEMLRFTEVDKKKRLSKLASLLSLKPMPDELEEWESSDEEEVTMNSERSSNESEDCEEGSFLGLEEEEEGDNNENGEDSSQATSTTNTTATASQNTLKRRVKQRVLVTKRRHVKRFQLGLLKPPSNTILTRSNVFLNKISCTLTCTCDPSTNNSITLSVGRSNNRSINDRSSITLTRKHLHLLLSNQYPLFLRSNYKFSSLKAVAEFMMQRVDTTTDWTSTSPSLTLTFNRSVSLPSTCRNLTAMQEEDSLLLSNDAVDATSESAGNDASAASTSRASAVLALDEMISLAAAEKYHNHHDINPNNPFASVLGRISPPGNGAERFEIDRNVYKTTATLSGSLHNVSVDVLPNNQYVFSTSTLVNTALSDLRGIAGKPSATPLILSIKAAQEILPSDTHPSIFKPRNCVDMIKMLIPKLVLVKGSDDAELPMLQSPLYVNTRTLKIRLNDLSPFIGSVEIDNWTTLADLRRIITSQIDKSELPASFRIMYKHAPTSKAQEKSRLAFDLLPVVSLRCKEIPTALKHAMEQELEEKIVQAARRAAMEGGDPGRGSPQPDNASAVAPDNASTSNNQKLKHRGRKVQGIWAGSEAAHGSVTFFKGDDSKGRKQSPAHSRPQRGSRSPSPVIKSRSPSPSALGSPKQLSIEVAVASVSPALSPLNALKAKRRTLQGIKNKQGSSKPKASAPNAPETIPVPLEAMVTCIQGGIYVKCSKDLTRILEPGAVIRIGNPYGQNYKISDCPPPHVVEEIEKKKAHEEHKRLAEETKLMQKEDVNVAEVRVQYEMEDDLNTIPADVRDEMERQKNVIRLLRKQLQNMVEVKDAKTEEEASTQETQGLNNPDDDGDDAEEAAGVTSRGEVKSATSNIGDAPPVSTLVGNVFTPHFFTLVSQFDYYRASKKQVTSLAPGQAGAKKNLVNTRGRSKGDKKSPKKSPKSSPKSSPKRSPKNSSRPASPNKGSRPASPSRGGAGPASPKRSKEPIFKRPAKKGESPKRVVHSSAPLPSKDSESAVNLKGAVLRKLAPPSDAEEANVNFEALEKATSELHPEDGDALPELRIWKVVLKESDTRKKWRVAYDNVEVPYNSEFSDSTSKESHFGVTIKWSGLEEWCKDVFPPRDPDPCTKNNSLDWGFNIEHQQRADHFPKLPYSTIIDEAYKSICATQPPTAELDGTKWAKFVRDIELFPENMRRTANTHTDLAFTRQVAKNKMGKQGGRGANRVIDTVGFTHAMMEVSALRFPYLSEEEALGEALFEYVAMMPDINKRCWTEAKISAMKHEAFIQCAAIRSQTEIRRKIVYENYTRKRRNCIIIQKWLRGRLYLKIHNARRSVLTMDRAIRRRYAAAKMIKKAYLAHVCHELYMENLRRKIAEERRKAFEYRKKLRAQREERERGILYREATNINGTLCNITWKKKDPRAHSLDMTVIMEVYVPPTCGKFSFEVKEEEMKYFAEREAVKLGAVSYGEVMDVRNLVKLKTRLKCRVVRREGQRNYPTFKYSRKVQSERGVVMMSRGYNISHMAVDRKKNVLVPMKGKLYIASAYRSTDAITFLAYDPKTSRNLRASVTLNLLVQWIRKEEISKIRRAQNEKRQRVADAHKILELYKIGVKYEDDKIMQCIAVIEAWLEARRKDSVSVVPEKKQEKGMHANNNRGRKTNKKMTNRQIQMAAITQGGDIGENDEEESVLPPTAMVLRRQDSERNQGPESSLLNALASPSPQEEGKSAENPQEPEGWKKIEIPPECEMSLADILGNNEDDATFMDKVRSRSSGKGCRWRTLLLPRNSSGIKTKV